VSDPATDVKPGRVRPITTVLDVLRPVIDDDAFDAALFALEAVAADLGYGDVRALPGSVAWIEQLRKRGKRIGLFATGDRANAALELAGITDLFDEVTVGTSIAPTLLASVDALGVAPERTIVVAASAAAVAAARDAAVGIVIALARGFNSPDELRQAGATDVVADLQELLRAVT
jgi:beta-phosphoglucomutase-like phosphatase (HAD superfamily)